MPQSFFQPLSSLFQSLLQPLSSFFQSLPQSLFLFQPLSLPQSFLSLPQSFLSLPQSFLSLLQSLPQSFLSLPHLSSFCFLGFATLTCRYLPFRSKPLRSSIAFLAPSNVSNVTKPNGFPFTMKTSSTFPHASNAVR